MSKSMIDYISSLRSIIIPELLGLVSKPVNVMDVLLITLVAYVFIKLVLETKSLPVISSILIILGFYGFSVVFNLPLTRLVVQYLLSILVIILAIIFQNELKRI